LDAPGVQGGTGLVDDHVVGLTDGESAPYASGEVILNDAEAAARIVST